MDSHHAPAPNPVASPLAAITRDTHRRYFQLPAEIRKREEQEQQAKRECRKAKRLLHMKTTYWKEHDRLTVSLSPAQSQRLATHAERAGQSRTALFRAAAFAFLDGPAGEQDGEAGAGHPQRPQAPAAPPAAAQGDPEVRRLGVLLNQIARHVNRNRQASQRELTACREIFTRIEERFGGPPA